MTTNGIPTRRCTPDLERLASGREGAGAGTKLWVQFAAVRHGVQSAWCTPVLVTIP
jgi:hypothetical protein